MKKNIFISFYCVFFFNCKPLSSHLSIENSYNYRPCVEVRHYKPKINLVNKEILKNNKIVLSDYFFEIINPNADDPESKCTGYRTKLRKDNLSIEEKKLKHNSFFILIKDVLTQKFPSLKITDQNNNKSKGVKYFDEVLNEMVFNEDDLVKIAFKDNNKVNPNDILIFPVATHFSHCDMDGAPTTIRTFEKELKITFYFLQNDKIIYQKKVLIWHDYIYKHKLNNKFEIEEYFIKKAIKETLNDL